MAEEQSEETKQEAREFMTGLVGSGLADQVISTDGPGADMKSWKATYNNKEDSTALMHKFWSEYYNPNTTSIWTMVYDEPEYNENLDDTINIVKEFMKMSASLDDHCFGIIHILEGTNSNFEIEGLWFFNGPDPEKLFGVNEDTSWYTWNQIGPEPNEHVKTAVGNYIAPADSKLNDKIIKNTQAF